jgi:hypothetical protein
MRYAMITTVLASFIGGTMALAAELVPGVYSTVTESECNTEITIKTNGSAVVTEVCRMEDGSHRDVRTERKLRWSTTGLKVAIIGSGYEASFIINKSLSCEVFGKSGSAYGLVGLDGQNLWKLPIACK